MAIELHSKAKFLSNGLFSLGEGREREEDMCVQICTTHMSHVLCTVKQAWRSCAAAEGGYCAAGSGQTKWCLQEARDDASSSSEACSRLAWAM